MSEICDLYINEKGELVLKKDIIEALHLQDNKVECIVKRNQIILRNPVSVIEELFGCWGEESEEDYDFHTEIELFGREDDVYR